MSLANFASQKRAPALHIEGAPFDNLRMIACDIVNFESAGCQTLPVRDLAIRQRFEDDYTAGIRPRRVSRRRPIIDIQNVTAPQPEREPPAPCQTDPVREPFKRLVRRIPALRADLFQLSLDGG